MLVNKDFLPWGKMSVSDVFLDTEFKYVSRISLSPTTFALHQTMWQHKPTYVSHWGPVGGILDMLQQAGSRVIHVWLTASAGCWPELTVLSSQKYSVYSTITMPRKCVNSSDAFCYICSEVTCKSRGWSMLWALFRLQSGWSGQELCSQFLLCDMCQASRSVDKRVTLYAVRHSCGLKTAHGTCFRLLLLPDQYQCCNSKVQTHCSLS